MLHKSQRSAKMSMTEKGLRDQTQMTFQQTNTLKDNTAKYRTNVEAMARIQISDVEFILAKLKATEEARLRRILIETATTKIAAGYQLFMRACDYNSDGCKDNSDSNLQQVGAWFDELRTQSNQKHLKANNSTALGKVAHARDKMFHEGITFIDKTLIYPFAKIDGCGFVGIWVKLGGRLNITGVQDFHAKEAEYAITSEGVFEINNPGEIGEEWHLTNMLPNLNASDEDRWIATLVESLELLKGLWFQVADKMREGDGKNALAFLDEGGHLELFAKPLDGGSKIDKLDEGMALRVEGELTITPVDGVEIRAGSGQTS